MRIYFAGPLFTPYERQLIAEHARKLEARGHQVFVPHEAPRDTATPTAESCFRIDFAALREANVIVACLNGAQVDDGTACEIGIFYGMSLTDPSKKAIIAFSTDYRMRQRANSLGKGINIFVLGCIEKHGVYYEDFDDVLRKLDELESASSSTVTHAKGSWKGFDF